MTPPFFSVVIPTYNQAQFLKEAIRSVLSQSFESYEIIIIDNFSKDETEKIVNDFKNNKIIYKKINNNGIISKSRNEGIKCAKGTWIAFLDSDDIWYSDRLKFVYEFLEKNKYYDVICTDELINDRIRKRKKVWKYGPYTNNFYKRLLESGNCLTTSASIVKKDFLLTKNIFFDERKIFFSAEDYEFFMQIANADAKFKFLHKVLGERLFHKNSYSSNYQMHKSAITSVVKHHVFNIQTFTKNKEKLWNSIKVNFQFKDIIFLFIYEKKYSKSFMLFLNVLFISPLKILLLTFKQIKKFFF